MDDRLASQYVFFGLAAVAASQGRLVRATRLWAVADVVREIYGMQLLPWHIFPWTTKGASLRSAPDLERRPLKKRGKRADDDARRGLGVRPLREGFATPASSVPERPPARESPTVLTRREEEVASLVARGYSNRQVSSELPSPTTVATHVRRILKSWGSTRGRRSAPG